MPARGKTWAKSSVLKMLRNTAYIGYVYWNKSRVQGGLDIKKKRLIRDTQEWIKISIPSIIDESIFTAANERLEYSSKMVRRPSNREFLLASLVICEECGKAYISEGRKARPSNREKNDRKQYRHRIKEGHCSNHIMSARQLEECVWNKIVEFLVSPETMLNGYKQAIENGKLENQREFALLDELTKAGVKYEKRLKNLITAYRSRYWHGKRGFY